MDDFQQLVQIIFGKINYLQQKISLKRYLLPQFSMIRWVNGKIWLHKKWLDYKLPR